MKLLILLVLFVIGGGAAVWWNQSLVPGIPGTSTEDASREDVSVLVSPTEVTTLAHEQTGKQVEVYDGIWVRDTSTELDLSGRQLTGSLKAEVRQLENLIELNLSDNQLTGIPAEIGQLRQLRILNLSNNPITGLPNELGNLQKLQVLDLRDTNYARQDLDGIRTRLPQSVLILVD